MKESWLESAGRTDRKQHRPARAEAAPNPSGCRPAAPSAEIPAAFLEPFTASALCRAGSKMQMEWGHLKKNTPANCAPRKKKGPRAQRAIFESVKLRSVGRCFILMDNVRCASPS